MPYWLPASIIKRMKLKLVQFKEEWRESRAPLLAVSRHPQEVAPGIFYLARERALYCNPKMMLEAAQMEVTEEKMRGMFLSVEANIPQYQESLGKPIEGIVLVADTDLGLKGVKAPG